MASGGLVTGGSFSGQVVVVTGASRGIGRATALEFARRGATLVLHARSDRDRLQAVADEARALGGGEVQRILEDLVESAAPDRLAEAAWSWRQRVDVWVNNAGVDVLTGPQAHLPWEEKAERLWAVDVLASMRLTRHVAPRMRQLSQRDGAIRTCIHIGWDQAESGMGGDSGELFAAIKGAVMAFTRSAAKSYAPLVRVNAVAPGWIRTAWGEQASPAWQERAQRESLAGRWGRPEDVAQAIVWLASPEAEFVNGQILHVNGGFRGSVDGIP